MDRLWGYHTQGCNCRERGGSRCRGSRNEGCSSYTIVAGNPAKLIGERFDENVQGLIEDLAWWNLNAIEIKSIEELFAAKFIDSETAQSEIADAIAKLEAQRR